MTPERTAVLLTGFQNEFFASHGALHNVVRDTAVEGGILGKTLDLLERLRATPVLFVYLPLGFTPGYPEIVEEPVGVLKLIKESNAFQCGTKGYERVPELDRFSDRILTVPGKKGFDPFVDTELDKTLKERGISDVVISGVVTSLCVDSTGRAAVQKGYRPTVLGDCTAGSSPFEQTFYCEKVIPLYASVMDRAGVARALGAGS